VEPDSGLLINLGDLAYIIDPVDWQEAWRGASAEEEWIAWPLLPEGRTISLYGEAKNGKSLLALELVGCLATGRQFLGRPTAHRRVLYVDSENSVKKDVIPRLSAMGFEPDDLDNLVYLTYPEIPKLDTEAGGRAVISNLDYHDCDVLVIDTVSMNISGEENSNDTWLRFQEHTGLALKRNAITVLRIDHAGKGSATGPRGGSAKGGSVDAEWRIRRYSDGTMTLKCENHRMPIHDQEVTIEIVEDPLLTHRIVSSGHRPSRGMTAVELADALDKAGYPSDMTHQVSRTAMKELGLKVGSTKRDEAIRLRKERGFVDPPTAVSEPTDEVPVDDDEYYEYLYDQSGDVEDYCRDNRFEFASLDSFGDKRG
jgi:hypothetical protein